MFISQEDYKILSANCYTPEESLKQKPDVILLTYLKSPTILKPFSDTEFRSAFSRYVTSLVENNQIRTSVIADSFFYFIKTDLQVGFYKEIVLSFLVDFKKTFFHINKNVSHSFIIEDFINNDVWDKIEKQILALIKKDILAFITEDSSTLNNEDIFDEDIELICIDNDNQIEKIRIKKMLVNNKGKEFQGIFCNSYDLGASFFISKNKNNFQFFKKHLYYNLNRSFVHNILSLFYRKSSFLPDIINLIRTNYSDLYELYSMSHKDSGDYIDKVLFRQQNKKDNIMLDYTTLFNFFKEIHESEKNLYCEIMDFIVSDIVNDLNKENGYYLLSY